LLFHPLASYLTTTEMCFHLASILCAETKFSLLLRKLIIYEFTLIITLLFCARLDAGALHL
jgi:hypothetical protein